MKTFFESDAWWVMQGLPGGGALEAGFRVHECRETYPGSGLGSSRRSLDPTPTVSCDDENYPGRRRIRRSRCQRIQTRPQCSIERVFSTDSTHATSDEMTEGGWGGGENIPPRGFTAETASQISPLLAVGHICGDLGSDSENAKSPLGQISKPTAFQQLTPVPTALPSQQRSCFIQNRYLSHNGPSYCPRTSPTADNNLNNTPSSGNPPIFGS